MNGACRAMAWTPPQAAGSDLGAAARDVGGAEIIHVIDADQAARHSLCLLLKVNGLEPRAHASAEDFLAEAGPSDRGCVITDLRFELIDALKARKVRLPVIVVTGSGNVSAAVAAMRAGAVDLFEKPYEGDTLLRSVYRALDAQRAARAPGAAEIRRDARLTPRESQVFDRVAQGESNKAIAQALGISPRTVEIYRASVMAKLDVSSIAELVRVWLECRGPHIQD